MRKQLLAISDFCDAYSVSRSKAYELLRSGDLMAVKFGKRTYIRPEDAAIWASQLQRFVPTAAAEQRP